MESGGRSRAGVVLGVCLATALLAVPLASSNLTLLSGVFPALNHSFTLDQGALPKMITFMALLAAACLAWAWSNLRTERPVFVPRFWPLLLAFALVAIASTVVSVDPSTSVFGVPCRREGLVTLLSCVVFSVLVVQYVRSPDNARWFAKAAVWAGSLIALYGLHQVAGVDPQDWGERIFEARRAFATMGNPDLFAGYLVLILPLGIGLAVTTRTALAREGWWVLSAVMGVALLLSGVRGAWVGGAVALAALIFSLTRSGTRLHGIDVLTVGAGLCAAMIAAVMTPHWTFERLNSVLSLQPLATRAQIWTSSIAAAVDRPLLGWGPDTFRYAWLQHATPTYVAAYSGEGIVDNAHDYYLQLAVTLGGLGALLFVAIVAYTLFDSRAVLCGHSDDRRLVSAWWAAVAGYSVFLIVGLVDVAALVVLWCALGVLAAAQARPMRVPLRVMRAVSAAACAVAIVGVGAVGMLGYADHSAAQGLAAGEYPQRLAGFERAVGRAPWDHTYLLALGDVLSSRACLEASMDSAQSSSATAQETGRLTMAAVDAYREALADVERESRAVVGIARTYRSAEECLDVSYAGPIADLSERYGKYAPYEPSVQSWYLPALVEAGRWDEIEPVVEKYRLVDPGSQAWLVRAFVMTGRDERARRLAKDLVEQYPYDLRVQALSDLDLR